jgi:hypothetical protein
MVKCKTGKTVAGRWTIAFTGLLQTAEECPVKFDVE